MAKKLAELLQERFALTKRAREIITAAKDRPLTMDERVKYDRIMNDVDELGVQAEGLGANVQRAKVLDALQADMTRPLDKAIIPDIGGGRGGGELVDGKEVRTYKPGEAIAFEKNPDFDVGRVIQASLTKDYSRCSHEERDASIAVLTGGGFTVPQNSSREIIQYARDTFALGQVARFVDAPMSAGGNIRIARVTGEPTAAWYAENQTIAASSMTFGSVDMSLKKIATYIPVSRELAKAGVGFLDQLRSSLSYSVMRGLEIAAFEGTGAGAQPKGIDNDPDVLLTDAASAAITLENYQDNAYWALKAYNAPDPLHMVAHSKWFNFLDTLTTASLYAMSNPNGGMPASVSTVRRHVSNVLTLASNHGNIYTLAEGALVVALDPAGTEIAITEQTSEAFTKNQVWVRVILMADIAIAQPKHIHVYRNVDFA